MAARRRNPPRLLYRILKVVETLNKPKGTTAETILHKLQLDDSIATRDVLARNLCHAVKYGLLFELGGKYYSPASGRQMSTKSFKNTIPYKSAKSKRFQTFKVINNSRSTPTASLASTLSFPSTSRCTHSRTDAYSTPGKKRKYRQKPISENVKPPMPDEQLVLQQSASDGNTAQEDVPKVEVNRASTSGIQKQASTKTLSTKVQDGLLRQSKRSLSKKIKLGGCPSIDKSISTGDSSTTTSRSTRSSTRSSQLSQSTSTDSYSYKRRKKRLPKNKKSNETQAPENEQQHQNVSEDNTNNSREGPNRSDVTNKIEDDDDEGEFLPDSERCSNPDCMCNRKQKPYHPDGSSN